MSLPIDIDDKKAAFSQRLKRALADNHLPSNSPTHLAKMFNATFQGKPVSVQAASSWLGGVSIPSHAKVMLLAQLLGVSSEWLRFGEGEMAQDILNLSELPDDVQVIIKALLQMDSQQRSAIYEVIKLLVYQ